MAPAFPATVLKSGIMASTCPSTRCLKYAIELFVGATQFFEISSHEKGLLVVGCTARQHWRHNHTSEGGGGGGAGAAAVEAVVKVRGQEKIGDTLSGIYVQCKNKTVL